MQHKDEELAELLNNGQPYEYGDKQAEVEGVNTWQARVTGRVHNVGYRAFAQHAAEELGICGFARNEPDGSVTVHMQHPETRILELYINKLQEGPSGSDVDEVYVEQLAGEPRCTGFRTL